MGYLAPIVAAMHPGQDKLIKCTFTTVQNVSNSAVENYAMKMLNLWANVLLLSLDHCAFSSQRLQSPESFSLNKSALALAP